MFRVYVITWPVLMQMLISVLMQLAATALQKSMQRVVLKCHDRRLASRPFYAQANLLTAGLLSNLDSFKERIKEFHDRSGQV